jgi:hypothetical protein
MQEYLAFSERVKAAQDVYVARATNPEFAVGEGAVIAGHLNKLIAPEVQLALAQPNLYIVPPNANLDISEKYFNHGELAALEGARAEFLAERSSFNSEARVELNHTENSQTRLAFVTTPLSLMNNQWTCLGIYTGGSLDSYLPLGFEQTLYGMTVFDRRSEWGRSIPIEPDKLSEDELNERIQFEESREMGELNSLRQIIDEPRSIMSIFSRGQMSAYPSRLMTRGEYNEWNFLVNRFRTRPILTMKKDGSSTRISCERHEESGENILVEEFIPALDAQEADRFILRCRILPIKVDDQLLGWQVATFASKSKRLLSAKLSYGGGLRIALGQEMRTLSTE